MTERDPQQARRLGIGPSPREHKARVLAATRTFLQGAKKNPRHRRQKR